ncbi:VWA domain-containing protein [Nitrosophilus labii]|uniref:VWA domain-containing protein n=1 Tax=Nitrosophilus labii TaxID=2706014 RepID=UPI0016569062|nr:VWA domain-containing protein [Nitrosophilus labii]
MSFLYPWFLAFTLPSLLLFFYIKKKQAKIYFNEKIIIEKSDSKFKLLPIVVVLIFISLARPVIEKSVTDNKSLNTIFIALDVSNSMLARDFKPNRLAQAKKMIKQFISMSDLKTSLIIFTTNPLIITPPTNDKEISKIALDSIDTRYILSKGTDFENLLKFVANFEGEKNLVIFSDGGEFKNSEELIQLAKRNKIKIFGVKVATKEGELIPTDEGFLKDSDNRLVVSRLNPDFIKLSKLSSNEFYDETNYLDILDGIKKIDSKDKEKIYIELFFIPLFIATMIYLYIFTTIFSKIKFIKNLLPLLLIVSLNASVLDEYKIKKGYEKFYEKDYKEAEKIFENLNYLEAKFALGITKIKEGKFPKAIKILKSIKTKDKKIKSKIYFNIAYAYEKMRNYDKAKKFYIKSMQLFPKKSTFKKIENLVFKTNQKKPLLPFSKQKIVPKKSENSKQKSKNAGSANMNLAIKSSSDKGGKKAKNSSISFKKTKSIPVSSKVYELINKGYVNEKNPW